MVITNNGSGTIFINNGVINKYPVGEVPKTDTFINNSVTNIYTKKEFVPEKNILTETKKDVIVYKTVEQNNGGFFSMGIFEFVGLVVLVFVIAKMSNYFGLKTIFSPTKKAVKTVQKEWEDA